MNLANLSSQLKIKEEKIHNRCKKVNICHSLFTPAVLNQNRVRTRNKSKITLLVWVRFPFFFFFQSVFSVEGVLLFIYLV